MQHRYLVSLADSLAKQDESTLKDSLKSDKIATRFAAAFVVGEKKTPLPQELIDMLGDKNLDVQQMARRSLILLGCHATVKSKTGQAVPSASAYQSQVNRLLKLGPTPSTAKWRIETATQKWKEWWAQNDPELEKLKNASLLTPEDKPPTKK